MSADNNRYYMNQVGVPGGLEYLGATLTETVPDPVDFEAVVAQSACAELADYPYNDLQVGQSVGQLTCTIFFVYRVFL